MTTTEPDLAVWANKYRHPAFWLATWFGAGLARPGPGTVGSLVALPFAWVITLLAGPVGLAAAVIVVFLAGLWAASVFSRHTNSADAGQIVIDEVAGQWLTLLPFSFGVSGPDIPLLLYAEAFVAFRLFDIAKPWPIRPLERRITGGLGVMVDDVLAAGYAIIVLVLAFRIL